jgi:glycine/D-amino acid oxidase-like deaminating enzyme
MQAVVVGGGVFGAWTAHHLNAAGASVTLVDGYGPGNSRSSSGDETRILRCGYGPDRIYSDLARRSLVQWRALDTRLGAAAEPLWHSCGVLWIAAGHDPYTAVTRATLEQGSFGVQVLDNGVLRHEFPQVNPDGIEVALLEPDAGVLAARRAVRALAADLERRGVRVLRAHAASPSASGTLREVHLDDGSTVTGDLFVFACGAWLPQVFRQLLGGRIRPTRQVVVYFGTSAGDRRFGPDRMPAWIDFPAGIYGTPDIDGRGVKVGLDDHGPAIDPDRDDRVADDASVQKARDWLARRLPALTGAPVNETRVCQYENTATGDFLIDRHPDCSNVWIVGGGSGHGFKHGPAVGEMAARLALTGEPAHPRFAFGQETSDARRTVY